MIPVKLPQRFAYLQVAADTCKGIFEEDEQWQLWKRLDESSRTELESSFLMANRKEQRAALVEWLTEVTNEPGVPRQHGRMVPLLMFYDLLAKKGIEPFARSREPFVTFGPEHGKVGDWSELSPELKELIPVFEDYGRIYAEDDMAARLDAMPDEEFQELKQLISRIDAGGLGEKMATWCDQFKTRYPQEVARIENLLLFFDIIFE